MTMWAEKGIAIQTVIVIVGDMAVGYLLFSACEERTKVYRKNAGFSSCKHGICGQMPACQGACAP